VRIGPGSRAICLLEEDATKAEVLAVHPLGVLARKDDGEVFGTEWRYVSPDVDHLDVIPNDQAEPLAIAESADDDQADEPPPIAESIAAINAGATRERLEHIAERLDAVVLVCQPAGCNEGEPGLGGRDVAIIESLVDVAAEQIRAYIGEIATK